MFKSDRGALSVEEERETLSTTCSSSERSFLVVLQLTRRDS